jgi:hypothetical protein
MMRFFAALSLIGLVAQAHAQPAEAPAKAPVVAGTDDAHAGHTWLAPTALTSPAGSWSISSVELLLIGGTYAITDRLEVGAMTFLPAGQFDGVALGWGHAKMRVVDAGNVHGALRLDGIYTYEGMDHYEDVARSEAIAAASAVVTVCIDDACRSHASASGGVVFAGASDDEVPFAGALSTVIAVSKRMKLVFELDAGYTANDPHATPYGVLAWAGVRLATPRLGIDLGVAKPICDNCVDDDFKLGIPFLAATYRSLPD